MLGLFLTAAFTLVINTTYYLRAPFLFNGSLFSPLVIMFLCVFGLVAEVENCLIQFHIHSKAIIRTEELIELRCDVSIELKVFSG